MDDYDLWAALQPIMPAGQPAPDDSLLHKLGHYALYDSIPSKMVQSAYSGLTAPGDAYYHGMTPDEAESRAWDMAGLATGGAGVVPAEGAELRAGLNWQRMGDNPSFDQDALQAASRGKHPISGLTLKQPMADVTAAYGPSATDMLPRQAFDFQSVPMGSQFVPLQGDTTAAGRQILGVNGAEFSSPVNQYGGAEFARGPQQIADQAYWAAGQGEATKMTDTFNSLLGDGPVYPSHVSMSAQSGDFSGQTTKTLREMLAANPVSDKAIDAFNKAMRENTIKKLPPVPGFDIRNMSDEWLAQPNNGWIRAKVAKLMDTKPFQSMGYPSVAAARMAVTEPELFGKGAGATGFSISRMENPVSVAQNPIHPHPDYPGQMVGAQYAGGTHPIPPQVFWRDFFATRPEGESMENSLYALKRPAADAPIVQRMTPEFLDHIMSYQEQQRNLDWILRGGS